MTTPDPLHYVEFFGEKGRDELVSILLHRFPFTLLLWIGIAVLCILAYRFFRKRRHALNEESFQDRSPRRPANVRVLAVLFLASFLLNLCSLGQESISSMEGTYLSETAVNENLLQALFNSNGVLNSHFPSYRLLLHPLLKLDHSLVFLRGISAFFGALCIPVLYLFLRALFSDPVARVAAILLLVSPIHVHVSQSAMPYSLVTLLVLLYVLAYAWMAAFPSRRNVFLYVTVTAVGLNTHAVFLGVLLPPFVDQTLEYLKRRNDRKQRYLFSLYLEKTFLAGIFFLPFLLMQLSFLAFFSRDFTRYMAYIEVIPPLHALGRETLNFFAHLANLVAGFEGKNPLIAGLAGAVFLASSLYLLASSGLRAFLLLAGPCYCLILLQFLAILYLGQINFVIRYYCFFPAFFWATLMGAAGTLLSRTRFGVRMPGLWGAGRPALPLFLLGASLLYPSAQTLRTVFSRLDNPDIRAVAAFLRAHMEDGDALCVTPASFFGDIVLYHLHEPWEDLQTWESWMNTFRLNALTTDRGEVEYFSYISNRFLPWEEASRNLFFERIWLVVVREATLGFLGYSDGPSERVKAFYDREFEAVGRWSFPHADIFLYRPLFSVPGVGANPFTLTFGRDDYPYLREVSPPPTRTAPCRTIGLRSEIRVPLNLPASVNRLRVTLAFRTGDGTCAARELSVGFLLGDTETAMRCVIDESRSDQQLQEVVRVPDEEENRDMLRIWFAPDPETLPEEACVPALCLLSLRVEPFSAEASR